MSENSAPFKDLRPSSSPTNTHRKIQQSPRNPNHIVRTDDHLDIHSQEYGKTVISEQQALLREVETYGIQVAKHTPIIGHPAYKNSQDISIHNVVENIEGSSLHTRVSPEERASYAVEFLY